MEITSLPIKAVSQPFQIVFAYSCGRAKTSLKRHRVDVNIFENKEKKLRFQTKTDTCGQGLI